MLAPKRFARGGVWAQRRRVGGLACFLCIWYIPPDSLLRKLVKEQGVVDGSLQAQAKLGPAVGFMKVNYKRDCSKKGGSPSDGRTPGSPKHDESAIS